MLSLALFTRNVERMEEETTVIRLDRVTKKIAAIANDTYRELTSHFFVSEGKIWGTNGYVLAAVDLPAQTDDDREYAFKSAAVQALMRQNIDEITVDYGDQNDTYDVAISSKGGSFKTTLPRPQVSPRPSLSSFFEGRTSPCVSFTFDARYLRSFLDVVLEFFPKNQAAPVTLHLIEGKREMVLISRNGERHLVGLIANRKQEPFPIPAFADAKSTTIANGNQDASSDDAPATATS